MNINARIFQMKLDYRYKHKSQANTIYAGSRELSIMRQSVYYSATEKDEVFMGMDVVPVDLPSHLSLNGEAK